MIQRKQQGLNAIYFLIDALASIMAMLVAYYLRFALEVIPVTKGWQGVEVYTHILPLVAVIFPLAFLLEGVYRPRSSRSEEWVSVIIGTVLGTVVLSGMLLWIRPSSPNVYYSRATLAMFALAEVVFILASHTAVRSVVERRHRQGKDLDRVLIAGNGELARAVVDRMSRHRELGFEIVGYVALDEMELDGLKRLGSLEEAAGIVRREGIDHVYVAVPQSSGSSMMILLDSLMREFVSIHVVPDLLQYMALRSRVEDLDGLPTVNLSDSPLMGWSRFVKRAFDLAVSLAALILVWPAMALIALLIWMEDRGPIFYRQERMGLDGAPFQILKFRSMRPEAESETGAVWAHRDDPRRTKIGSLIRAWSLDELPQLWNVVRGEMSLVGPRPERPQFVEQFRSEFPHYVLRHRVRSGITGWAQVHGWRGNTSVRMRIEHDLYYIENWSLMLDMKILLMTVRHGLKHENAY
ncbi:MAG: undecaprenyl-phosphate glucose phosphotransferase [Acidobacteriota bacterium]